MARLWRNRWLETSDRELSIFQRLQDSERTGAPVKFSTEGTIAYSSLLSVVETCRLRQINPWEYISSVIKLARKGVSPPPLPTSVVS